MFVHQDNSTGEKHAKRSLSSSLALFLSWDFIYNEYLLLEVCVEESFSFPSSCLRVPFEQTFSLWQFKSKKERKHTKFHPNLVLQRDFSAESKEVSEKEDTDSLHFSSCVIEDQQWMSYYRERMNKRNSTLEEVQETLSVCLPREELIFPSCLTVQ